MDHNRGTLISQYSHKKENEEKEIYKILEYYDF